MLMFTLVNFFFSFFLLQVLKLTTDRLVSAFWHGVHSGYYLSMLTVPFILVAEDEAKRKFRLLVCI